MAKYKSIVTTEAGLVLVEDAAYMGHAIQFTALKTGNGTYDGTEDLAAATDLKNVCQTFGVGSVSKKNSDIVVRAAINNNGVTAGYSITEIGLYAMDPLTDTEVLYAVVIAETGNEDYFPPYAEAPTSITLEMVIGITEAAEVTFNVLPMEGAYVPVESFNEQVENIRKIVSGETTVGNANKLGGKGASEYALIDGYAPNFYDGKTEDEINQILNGLHSNATDRTQYTAIVNFGVSHSELGGSTRLLIGCRVSENYGWQIGITYNITVGKAIVFREIRSGVWSTWKEYATTADLANYLSKSGGTVTGTAAHIDFVDNDFPLIGRVGVLGSGVRLQKLDSNGNILAFLVVDDSAGIDNILRVSNDKVMHTVLHTGNKPTGTYTGNGDATQRTVSVGGVSTSLMIKNSGHGLAFVDAYGAITIGINGTVTNLGSGECKFKDGVLTMKTSNNVVNANGSNYDYHSL